MVSNQVLNSDSSLLAVAGGSPQPLFGAAPAGSALWLPLKSVSLGISGSAAGRTCGNTLMFGDSDSKSSNPLCQRQPAHLPPALAGTVALAVPAKHQAPLLLLSRGSFCFTLWCLCGWCGSWALCPTAGPSAAPPQPVPCQVCLCLWHQDLVGSELWL